MNEKELEQQLEILTNTIEALTLLLTNLASNTKELSTERDNKKQLENLGFEIDGN